MKLDRSRLALGAAGALASIVAWRLMAKRRSNGGPDPANESFHRAYDDARAREEDEGAILVVLADCLLLHRGNESRSSPISPALFHKIKSAAHVPVGAYAYLYDRADRFLDSDTCHSLSTLAARAESSLRTFGETGSDADAVRETLRSSIRFIEGVVSDHHVTGDALKRFAGDCGPLIKQITLYGTRAQLDALHAAVEALLALLDADERDKLQVVVTGDHQARSRSLGMQYFEKRFSEKPGEEIRVTYAEGVTSGDDAIALVGKRRLDRALASAFFGDPHRLQRDVLGDAATELLKDFSI